MARGLPKEIPPAEKAETESRLAEARDPETGRFLKGQSGNPAGRPVGSRNRANLVKEFIEEKLTDKLEKDALEILQVAIDKAKKGDSRMIKLLLGDMLASARGPAPADQSPGGRSISITINNLTRPGEPPPQVGVTIDATPEESPDGP